MGLLSNRALNADIAAEEAMRDKDAFRSKHSAYFELAGRTDMQGNLLIASRPELNREMFRLHQRAAELNKIALDIEYEEEIFPRCRRA